MFRALEPSEINVRVQQVKKTQKGVGAQLLLYKDARVDMALLDEAYGPMGWQRIHDVVNGNLFCTVSVWDAEKCRWIAKQDVGTESNTEKEKGQASDAFKRACTNFGIGRELYTAPFIWINLTPKEYAEKNGAVRIVPSAHFEVAAISYEEVGGSRSIKELHICDKDGVIRYSYPASKKELQAQNPKPQVSPNTNQPEPQEMLITKDQAKELVAITRAKWGDNAGDLFRSITGYDSTKNVPAFAFQRVKEMLEEAENYE